MGKFTYSKMTVSGIKPDLDYFISNEVWSGNCFHIIKDYSYSLTIYAFHEHFNKGKSEKPNLLRSVEVQYYKESFNNAESAEYPFAHINDKYTWSELTKFELLLQIETRLEVAINMGEVPSIWKGYLKWRFNDLNFEFEDIMMDKIYHYIDDGVVPNYLSFIEDEENYEDGLLSDLDLV